MKKIYSAFISSAFQSLRDERNEAIDVLLDFRILPIGMEHFTVSTNGEFSDIQELIDDSDFFIMLMGAGYGSCDKNGISWTEREYEYARSKGKAIIVVVCDELVELLSKDRATLTPDQQKQVDFCSRIEYARNVSREFTIKTIIRQFLLTYPLTRCVGWTRIEDLGQDETKLAAWRQSHKAFDLSGVWYHLHLSEEDDSYIRVGSVKIEQDFTPNNYTSLHIEGSNFNITHYNAAEGRLYENKMKSSRFVGDYTLQENGEIFGIFNSKRSFNGEFNSLEVNKGARRGIHDFTIDISSPEADTLYFDGEFHDEAPSPKQGRIFLFRSIDDRNSFLLENRGDFVEVKE